MNSESDAMQAAPSVYLDMSYPVLESRETMASQTQKIVVKKEARGRARSHQMDQGEGEHPGDLSRSLKPSHL